MALQQLREDILRLFGHQERIRYSLGPFDGNWIELKRLVDAWWEAYKAWEAADTLAAAFTEQRLTVKGTSTMDLPVSAQTRTVSEAERFGATSWGSSATVGPYNIVKTNKSIKARMDPTVFVPDGGGESRKTEQGLHDLSALLLNPQQDLSKQQYKSVKPDQVYVFMPISAAGDQAVFQNINALAKSNREHEPDFYATVRNIRSRMTRIKLAAEHDMAVSFIKVGEKNNRPKLKYTLTRTTDVSLRDEASGVIRAGTIKGSIDKDTVDLAFKDADPPLDYPEKGKKALIDRLNELLSSLKLKPFDPTEMKQRVTSALTNRDALRRLDRLTPAPSDEVRARCLELILDRAAKNTKGAFTTTSAILQARQNAAINFQSLVLGEIMRYGEVTVAYRHHGGDFPKFATFDTVRSLWIVGDIDDQNVWTARRPEESFADRPG